MARPHEVRYHIRQQYPSFHESKLGTFEIYNVHETHTHTLIVRNHTWQLRGFMPGSMVQELKSFGWFDREVWAPALDHAIASYTDYYTRESTDD